MRHCTVYRTVWRYSMPNSINLKNSVASNFAYCTLVWKTRYYCTFPVLKILKLIMPPSCHSQYSISGSVIICTDPALDPDPTLFFCSMVLYCTFNMLVIKGSVTRDFRLQVFFINQCPPGLWVSHWDHFEFFRKFAEIFANECLSVGSTTPAKKDKNFEIKFFKIFR
jgi:hypothetical protein